MHLGICIPVLCNSIMFGWRVLMKCFTRGIHWGAATQRVIPDLGNGFTEILSLTWHWMCNLRVWNGSEISWLCIIGAAAEIELGFFFFLLLLQGRLNSWYKVHTNMEKAVHAVVLVLVLHPTWPLSTHACLKSGKRGTFYNNHTIAHRIIRCSNNYNLRTAINFGYSRWFLFWLQLYRKVELWESIISLAVLDINTLAANSTDYPAFL